MYCMKCGAALVADAVFCTSCGGTIESDDKVSKAISSSAESHIALATTPTDGRILQKIIAGLFTVFLLAGGIYWYQIMRNTADAPVYEVGDTWTFASYCDLAYLNRAFSSDPVLLKKAVDRNCNPSTLQILNVGDYAHLKVRDTSNSGRDYSESNYEHWGFMGVLKFPDTKDSTQVPQSEKYPMKPGDVWQKSENIGSVSNITRVSRASGWETIRVPAGEFRAIKLVHESQTVFANDGAAFGHRRVEWYSPDAKVAVKVELNGVTRFELQSYHVK